MSTHRPPLSRWLFAGVFALPLLVAFSQVRAQAPAAPVAAPAGAGAFKDLQILPKNITKPELKATMKAMTKALGVDCEHCHKEPDMAADTNKKKLAREMMQMTKDLNSSKYASTMKKVTCWTCHRGKNEPEKQPTQP